MIRLARADDVDQIGRLWLEMVELHKAFDPLIFHAATDGADLYAQRILQRLSDPFTRVLVAESDAQVVAYALAMIADITTEMFVPLRTGLLADIYVRAEERRHGLGSQLVERMMLWFRSQDVRHFEWHVSANNPAALAFWRSMGGVTTMLRMRADIGGNS